MGEMRIDRISPLFHLQDIAHPCNTLALYIGDKNKGGIMGDLSEHFSRREFVCKGRVCCGGAGPVDGRLVTALEAFRAKVGVPVHITSGFRCHTYNRSIGSRDTSQHPKGYAADIARIEGMSIEKMVEIAETIEDFRRGGIGRYDTFLHVDVRHAGEARWRG